MSLNIKSISVKGSILQFLNSTLGQYNPIIFLLSRSIPFMPKLQLGNWKNGTSTELIVSIVKMVRYERLLTR